MSRKHRITREYDTYMDHDYTDREYTDRESVREKRKKRTERTERTERSERAEHSRRGRRLTRDYDMERERTEYMKRYLSKRRKKGHTKKK